MTYLSTQPVVQYQEETELVKATLELIEIIKMQIKLNKTEFGSNLNVKILQLYRRAGLGNFEHSGELRPTGSY